MRRSTAGTATTIYDRRRTCRPTSGRVTFCKRDLVRDLADPWQPSGRTSAIVGAPFDDAVSYRPGARFGPRAIRQATYNQGEYSLQLDIEPFERPRRGRCRRRQRRAGLARTRPRDDLPQGARGRRRAAPCRIMLGGDHSITWPSASAVAQASRRGASASSISTPTRTPPTTSGACSAGHGTPMRRLIESGAVKGKNFVQVGLRGYWPPPDVFAWMREQGMRWHLMREIEERGAEAVIDDAIREALDGPDSSTCRSTSTWSTRAWRPAPARRSRAAC